MSVFSKFLGKARADWLQLNDGSNNPSINQQFRLVLTAAQILALNGTPITLIAAAGAGTYISVDEVMAYLNFNSVAYAGSNPVQIQYTNGSGAQLTGSLSSSWLNSSSSAPLKVVAAGVTPVANAPVVVSVPTANPTAGNSTITLEGTFRIVTLP